MHASQPAAPPLQSHAQPASAALSQSWSVESEALRRVDNVARRSSRAADQLEKNGGGRLSTAETGFISALDLIRRHHGAAVQGATE